MGAYIEPNTSAEKTLRARKKTPPLLYFLSFIFVLFIGILVFCYAVTKRTNPVFLDANGKPVAESPSSSHH